MITLSLLTDLFITAWTLLAVYAGWCLGRRFPRKVHTTTPDHP